MKIKLIVLLLLAGCGPRVDKRQIEWFNSEIQIYKDLGDKAYKSGDMKRYKIYHDRAMHLCDSGIIVFNQEMRKMDNY